MKDNTLPRRATKRSALQIVLPDEADEREISVRRRDGSLHTLKIPFFSASDASAAQDQALSRDPEQGISDVQITRRCLPPSTWAKDEIFDRRDSAMMDAALKPSSSSPRQHPESTTTSFSRADSTSLPSTEITTDTSSSLRPLPSLQPPSALSTLQSTPRTSVTPGLGQGPRQKKRRRQDDLSIDGVGLNPLDETPQYRHLAADGKWYTDATIPAGTIPSWAVRSEVIEDNSSKSRSRRGTRRSREQT